jgi:transcriptional regulator GlxA family with amidase domain
VIGSYRTRGTSAKVDLARMAEIVGDRALQPHRADLMMADVRHPGPSQLTGARPKRVTIVTYPGVQVLDVTGPHEVFALANRFATDPPIESGIIQARCPGPPYEIELVARSTDRPGGPATRTTPPTPTTPTTTASSGLTLQVDRVIGGTATSPDERDHTIDTVIVAGGSGTGDAALDPDLLGWLVAVAPRCRRVASVCSGAFILAAAGLLDGRRATTHWSSCHLLQQLFPEVVVEFDPIFVRDGPIVTSAGITAGMDLALALVEEDLGRDLALAVSRWLVMFVQRPGGQSQFSSQLAAQLAERQPLRELQVWMADHPGEDLSVPRLAARVGMSQRHFARVFRDDIGVTPAQYVENVRVEVARRLLETTDRAIEHVAADAGFGTVETMQRAFQRRVHTTPRNYRYHFTRSGANHDRTIPTRR